MFHVKHRANGEDINESHMENQTLIVHCAGIDGSGRFLRQHTGRGEDLSPAFELENLSPKAKALAVTLEDISHPIRGFTHWVVWNLPASGAIPGGIPGGASLPSLGGARQGIGYGLHRYAGPKPPWGSTHKYRFTVYALDDQISLSAHSTKSAFLRKARGHILQSGSITGEFE